MPHCGLERSSERRDWRRRRTEWIVQSAQNGLPATLEVRAARSRRCGRVAVQHAGRAVLRRVRGTRETAGGRGCVHTRSSVPDRYVADTLIHLLCRGDHQTLTRPLHTGLEPHGVLPLSLVHFGNGGRLLPPALAADDRRRAFASSVIFNVPFVRVLWSWLGLRPASRTEIVRHLNGALEPLG